MRRERRKAGRAIAIALAWILASCSAQPVEQRPINPTPAAYSVSNFSLDRPCTLLTANDAADISGLPFYRTMAANLIQGSHVRCAQGVGAYGLHGVVEVDMAMAVGGVSAPDLFARECRSAPQRGMPAPAPQPPSVSRNHSFGEPQIDPAAFTTTTVVPVPVVNGQHCVLMGGAYILLMPDRVLYLRVRESAGDIDAAATRRLASLISFRLTSS